MIETYDVVERGDYDDPRNGTVASFTKREDAERWLRTYAYAREWRDWSSDEWQATMKVARGRARAVRADLLPSEAVFAKRVRRVRALGFARWVAWLEREHPRKAWRKYGTPCGLTIQRGAVYESLAESGISSEVVA